MPGLTGVSETGIYDGGGGGEGWHPVIGDDDPDIRTKTNRP